MIAIKKELKQNLEQSGCKELELIRYEQLESNSMASRKRLILFNKLALGSSAQTGIFTLFSAEIQTELSEIYRQYEYAEMYVKKVIDFVNNMEDAECEGDFSHKIIETEKSLCEKIPEVIKKIETELKIL